ncbi:KilA-N domain-containing protein [Parapedobacter composti]|uniref:KilA-N domain-containing protein n=1 Tax=Parapedobacter composti TaxID=623281 RepID=UPI0021D523D1|nr:KilA-N domain-containing protein [Parapedobacter composti]
MTPKRWIESTNAIGIVSKSGRYGGTYAHKDIALEFASWISIEFKLYVIKEFQRLKDDENNRLKLEWNLQRTLAKCKLSYPHRRHQRKSDTKQNYQTTGKFCLRQRSRFVECCPVRDYRKRMARQQS